MQENKNLIVYKESIFTKIIKSVKNRLIFKNIFGKKETNDVIQENSKDTSYINSSKQSFNELISFRENKEELELINAIRNNPEKLYSMDMEELDKIELAIRNRQRFVNKKIEKLKTDLAMKKSQI